MCEIVLKNDNVRYGEHVCAQRAGCLQKNKYKKIKITKNKMHTMDERQRLVKHWERSTHK